MGLAADLLGVQSVFLRSLDAVPSRDSRFHTRLAASGVLPTSLISVTVSDRAGASLASVIDQVLPSWWSGKSSKREPGNGQQTHRDSTGWQGSRSPAGRTDWSASPAEKPYLCISGASHAIAIAIAIAADPTLCR